MRKTTFRLSNHKKLTPVFWKRIGNTAIYSLPLVTSAVMASPMSATAVQWTNFVLTILLVVVKGITKFVTEEDEKNTQ